MNDGWYVLRSGVRGVGDNSYSGKRLGCSPGRAAVPSMLRPPVSLGCFVITLQSSWRKGLGGGDHQVPLNTQLWEVALS